MHEEAFEHFLDEGLIERVLRPLKTGKEAAVFLCRANPRVAGAELAALKVYHPLDRRDFRDESLYRDGEFIKERRVRSALEQRTRFGRQVQGAIWVDRELESLQRLSAAGAPVPRPIEATSDAILMSYVGDLDTAAPQLRSYRPGSPDEAQELFQQVVDAVQRMLFHDVVHADLSAYNVLVWEGRITVIDFPQAVDPKKNRHAEALLGRDLERIGRYFERLGADTPVERIAADLWSGWLLAELVPQELRGLADLPGDGM